MDTNLALEVDGKIIEAKPYQPNQPIECDNPLTVKEVTTMPVKVAEMGVVGAKAGSKDRVSVYDYKRGAIIYLSKRERVLADSWKKTFNYYECVRVLKAELGVEISPMTARRWLDRVHVKELLSREVKEEAMSRGYTEAKWKADGIEMQMNGGRVGFHQVVAWKELGKACGFYEPEIGMTNNVEISFKQSDGSM